MEFWKPIPGYEGIYDASCSGNIRSCPQKVTSNARYSRRVWKSRIMRQKITINGKGRADARVILWKDGKERTYLVARLVAMAWCDGYQDGLTVNHIDGNPLNNKADNLEWISLQSNINHAFDNGLNKCCKKVQLVNAESGESKSFRSFASASSWLGRSSGYVSACLDQHRNAVGKDGTKYFLTEGN